MRKINSLLTGSLISLTSSHTYANTASVNTPEAATILLLCLGAFGLGLARRRVKKSNH